MRPNSVKFPIQENNVTFYAWWTVCRDFTRSKVIKKYLGSSYVNQLIIFRNGDAKWGTDIHEWYNLGKSLLDGIIGNKFNLKQLVEEHFRLGSKVNELCRVIETTSPSRLSNKQIYKWCCPQSWTPDRAS
jgi:hypothetical protein